MDSREREGWFTVSHVMEKAWKTFFLGGLVKEVALICINLGRLE